MRAVLSVVSKGIRYHNDRVQEARDIRSRRAIGETREAAFASLRFKRRHPIYSRLLGVA